jgi:hypothetical protein
MESQDFPKAIQVCGFKCTIKKLSIGSNFLSVFGGPDDKVKARVMVMGGTDDRLHHIPISYAKEMEVHASFWQVEVRKVYLAGRQDVAALLDATGIASNRTN